MSSGAVIPTPASRLRQLAGWLWDNFHLYHDAAAAMRNDPAARGFFGLLAVILSYAGYHAVTIHRFTHLLWKLRIPLIPRLLSQVNRFLTGIEIHPGAQIGKAFFIDHGMGVVIGETTIIGDHVNLFHQVTLGGTGKETGKRHPTLGNHVTVGGGAKVLGNITIGDHVLVGANAVVLKDVPPNSTVVGIPGRVVRRHDERVHPEEDMRHDLIPDPIMKRLLKLQAHLELLERRLACVNQECQNRLPQAASLEAEVEEALAHVAETGQDNDDTDNSDDEPSAHL